MAEPKFFQFLFKDTKKIIISFVLIGFAVWGNALFNDFVWDDINQLVYNPLLHSVVNTPKFFFGSTFFNQVSGQVSGIHYRPIMSTIFAILYTFFGPQPFFYHFLQITLHITTSILLFYLFSKFFRKDMSYLLSLIFLVHPINVEAVSYISALHEVLFVFFGLMALLFLTNEKQTKKDRLVTFSFFGLSFFSKITGVLFAPIALLYDYLFKKKNLRAHFIGFSVVFLIFALFRFVFAGIRFERIPDIPIMRTEFWGRLLNAPAIIWFYIKTFFFPKNLLVAQYWLVTTPTWENFYSPIVFDLAFFMTLLFIGFLVGRYVKDSFRAFLFFLAWLVLGLGFHLQLVPLDFTVTEHWFYFPIIGMLGIIGVLLSQISGKSAKTFLYIIFFLLIPLLAVRTIQRNSNWKNDYTLFAHDAEISPPNYLIENFLGVELDTRGQLDEAKAHYEKSLELNPWGIMMFYNLGQIEEKQGNTDAALQDYMKLIKINASAYAYERAATLMITEKGDIESAEKLLQEATSKNSNDGRLWLLFAMVE